MLVITVKWYQQDGFSSLFLFITIVLNAVGLSLCLAPIPGILDKRYINGELTITNFFVFKRVVRLDEIDYVTRHQHEYYIYAKGKKRPVCLIDEFYSNNDTFMKILEEIGVNYKDPDTGLFIKLSIDNKDKNNRLRLAKQKISKEYIQKLFWKKNIFLIVVILSSIPSIILTIINWHNTITLFMFVPLLLVFWSPVFFVLEKIIYSKYKKAIQLINCQEKDGNSFEERVYDDWLIFKTKCIFPIYTGINRKAVKSISLYKNKRNNIVYIELSSGKLFKLSVTPDTQLEISDFGKANNIVTTSNYIKDRGEIIENLVLGLCLVLASIYSVVGGINVVTGQDYGIHLSFLDDKEDNKEKVTYAHEDFIEEHDTQDVMMNTFMDDVLTLGIDEVGVDGIVGRIDILHEEDWQITEPIKCGSFWISIDKNTSQSEKDVAWDYEYRHLNEDYGNEEGYELIDGVDKKGNAIYGYRTNCQEDNTYHIVINQDDTYIWRIDMNESDVDKFEKTFEKAGISFK